MDDDREIGKLWADAQVTRADDARIACPLFQAEYGGEVPTSALQLRVGKINYDLFQTLNRLWHSRLPECGNCFMGVCYGAEFGNKYYAVAWWSHPVARLLNGRGILELRRFAIAPDAPPNTASRVLSVMTKLVVVAHPEIRSLISYQDTEVHKGTIYKAAGWKSEYVSQKDDIWCRPNRYRKPVQTAAAKIRWAKYL